MKLITTVQFKDDEENKIKIQIRKEKNVLLFICLIGFLKRVTDLTLEDLFSRV